MPGFTIPDKGEGQHVKQSIVFQEHFDILVAGMSGVDCVLSGCAVTAQGTPDMTVAVAKGAVLSNGAIFAVAAGNVTITAADATNPRIDLVVISSSGAKAARAGTAAQDPKPPVRTANDVVIAMVYVPAADTTISTDQITDMRALRQVGPIVIAKQTTARVVNNTAAAFSLWATAPVIPNGLFLAGKILRVRAHGNILCNSGTPTWTLIISYGGTTMFQDVTVVGAVDADRRAWFLEYDIVAQANADQSLNGKFFAVVIAVTAPTTGIGDITTDESSAWAAFSGSAAVDSDAADRTLDTTFTMSVANAANETVIEGITVELL